MDNFEKLKDFKNKLNIYDKLNLDERDNTIISLLQKNPSISQEEIAKKVNLSQPSVGQRIKKLQSKGILHIINGVNFKIVDLYLAKIDVNSTDTEKTIKEFENCPFFLNALITSGKYNLCLLFMASDLKRLEGIVNCHLRSNERIKDIHMDIVISTAKDFVLPLNIDYENEKQLNCDQKCDHFL